MNPDDLDEARSILETYVSSEGDSDGENERDDESSPTILTRWRARWILWGFAFFLLLIILVGLAGW